MQTDRDIAHGLGDLDRHDLIAGGRLGVAEKRRAEQSHRAAGECLEQPLGGIDLEVTSDVRDVPEIGMGERVVADVVTFGHEALHEVRIGFARSRR